jgi:PTS system galactitol-specific IIC component
VQSPERHSAGVVIGIAFIGINLVIGLMWGALSEVGQALVKNLGITRDIVDVGWPSAAAIAFGTKVGLWVIPIAILVNIMFLLLRWTKTLNVDIWNFWHFAFVGSMVAAVSGSLAYGLIAAALALLWRYSCRLDCQSCSSFYGLPGISIPHLTTAPGVLLPFSQTGSWTASPV